MRYNVTVQHTRQRGILTTEHATSSYGQPVLVVDGVAYGPGDPVGGFPPYLDGDIVDADAPKRGMFDNLVSDDAAREFDIASEVRKSWNDQVANARDWRLVVV